MNKRAVQTSTGYFIPMDSNVTSTGTIVTTLGEPIPSNTLSKKIHPHLLEQAVLRRPLRLSSKCHKRYGSVIDCVPMTNSFYEKNGKNETHELNGQKGQKKCPSFLKSLESLEMLREQEYALSKLVDRLGRTHENDVRPLHAQFTTMNRKITASRASLAHYCRSIHCTPAKHSALKRTAALLRKHCKSFPAMTASQLLRLNAPLPPTILERAQSTEVIRLLPGWYCLAQTISSVPSIQKAKHAHGQSSWALLAGAEEQGLPITCTINTSGIFFASSTLSSAIPPISARARLAALATVAARLDIPRVPTTRRSSIIRGGSARVA